MNWNRLYGLRSYLRSSLWIVPFVAIPLALLVIRLLIQLDAWLGWTLLNFTVSGAEVLLQAFATATLSFVVFTFGSLLVAIQVASAQMTPRIIATTLLRNDVVRYTVGLFIFTLMFSLSAQNKMEKDVHQLVVLFATVLGVSSFAAFFYLIDYAARLLRPISILTQVGGVGLAVIENVYPDPSLGPVPENGERFDRGPPVSVVRHQGTSAIVQAANLKLLMAEAEKSDGIVEFVPEVGDFVAVDEPLFNLYGGAHSIAEDTLRASVASGRNAPWSRIPPSHFASSSTSRSRHCPRRSTTPPRPCSRSTSFIACCASSATATCEPTRSWTSPVDCAWCSARPIGRISCISPAVKSVRAARTICRSSGGCGR